MRTLIIMAAYTTDEQAVIDRFASDDIPPTTGSVGDVALINIVSQNTVRQKSSKLAFRVRTTGECANELSATINAYKDDFDLYMVELYKWFALPAVAAPDLELRIARTIEKRIRGNLERERAYMDRKQKCIEEIKSVDNRTGEPGAAARMGIDDVPSKPPVTIEIPSGTHVIRFKDNEPKTAKEKYVVFSYMELDDVDSGDSESIPGAEAILKIHGVFDEYAAAKDRSDQMHSMMRHKHLETVIGVLDAWLTIPPPEEAPISYGNDEHDAIYKDRWSTSQKIGVDAVKAYHAERDVHRELEADSGAESTRDAMRAGAGSSSYDVESAGTAEDDPAQTGLMDSLD